MPLSTSAQSSLLGPQSLRCLLAALLLLGSDVILWPNPLERPWYEWLLILASLFLLATVLLDLAARFRVRDVFGLFLLGGIYGLSASLLLYPTIALADVPLTYLSRALGSQSLAGLLALVMWRSLTAGTLAPLLALSVPAGLVWGVLAHWFPVTVGLSDSETSLAAMLLYGGIGLALIALSWQAAARAATVALRLSRRTGGIVVGILVALLALRWVQGQLDSLSLVMVPAIMAFCVALLWFQRNRRATPLVDTAHPAQAPAWRFVMVALAFVSMGIVGYLLPRSYPPGDDDPINVIGALFIMAGVLWLPAVSLVFGGRAFRRMVRAQKL